MHDGLIKIGVKARNSPDEILEYQTLKTHVDNLTTMLANETNAVDDEDTVMYVDDDNASVAPVADGSTGDAAQGNAPKRRKRGEPSGWKDDTATADEKIREAMTQAKIDEIYHDKWIAYCVRTTKAYVTLISMNNMSEAQLAAAIKASPIGSMKGMVNVSHVGIVADVKLSGETVTAPHVSVPSFIAENFTKLMGAATKARNVTGVVAPGDIAFIPDGGKHGLPGTSGEGGTTRQCGAEFFEPAPPPPRLELS